MATVISQIPADTRLKELLKLRAQVKAAYRDCPYFDGMLQEVEAELAKEFKAPWYVQGCLLLLYAFFVASSVSLTLVNKVEALWKKIRNNRTYPSNL